MAASDRERSADLAPLFAAGGERLSFFELVNVLQGVFPDTPRIGATEDIAREKVRFKANPSLGFPASEIERIGQSANGTIEVTLNLIGLFGPSSPLPTSVTERIVHAEGTNAVGDFLDLFNHRLAGLLALIGTHYRHHLRYEAFAGDPISELIGSLFGLPPDEEGHRDERRRMLMPYAGLLSLYSRSADGIAGVLSHALGIPCRIEEFVPRRIVIPESARFVLGHSSVELGVDMIAGETMDDVAGHFRVWLGPLTLDAYRSLLPGQPAFTALKSLLELIVRDPLSWDIGYTLKEDELGSWRLGEGELGWMSFLDPPENNAVPIIL